MTLKSVKKLINEKCEVLDDMHFFVNEIYSEWDEGKMEYDEAKKIILKFCNDFIKHNREEVKNGTN